MRARTLPVALLLAPLVALAGCGPDVAAPERDLRAAFADDVDDCDADMTPPGDAPVDHGAPPREEPKDEPEPFVDVPFGIVVVDVQRTFVDGAWNPDMDDVLADTAALLDVARDHAVPTFLTFEAADTGDHALHPALVAHVPEDAQRFIKTTFDATGLPGFTAALASSGLAHFVVVGSETDVCVMQTVLGMRRLGYTVLLARDAVFSSEPNVGPAFRRMREAGVITVDLDDVAAFAADQVTVPTADARPIPTAMPGEVGILLSGLTIADVDAASDPFAAAKRARLRELLLISAWFGVPLYSTDTAAALPASLQGLPIGPILDESAIDDATAQLVVAGTDAALADVIARHHDARTVFLMEDALLARDDAGALAQLLGARYDEGEVPLTYKSFYYELTRTVAFEDWPADWIARDAVYYDLTVAPESLPPITP